MKPENSIQFYIDSDSTSLKSQNSFLFYSRCNLVLIVSGAVFSAVSNFYDPEYRQIFVSVAAACLGLSIIATILLRHYKLEKVWYEGRAIAESVKTIAWRFATKATPYVNTLEKDLLILEENLISIYKKTEGIKLLKIQKPTIDLVSEDLFFIRSKTLTERREIYKNHRIDNQLSWYSSKADSNKKEGKKWYSFTLISQILAFIVIAYIFYNPLTSLAFVGIFTSLATASYAWLQLKQFNSISQAYLIAANELNQILLKIDSVSTDAEFSEFIIESENAISREHTLWIAKRS